MTTWLFLDLFFFFFRFFFAFASLFASAPFGLPATVPALSPSTWDFSSSSSSLTSKTANLHLVARPDNEFIAHMRTFRHLFDGKKEIQALMVFKNMAASRGGLGLFRLIRVGLGLGLKEGDQHGDQLRTSGRKTKGRYKSWPLTKVQSCPQPKFASKKRKADRWKSIVDWRLCSGKTNDK